MKCGVRNSVGTMSQLRQSGWQYQKGKVGKGARSWKCRKGTTTAAEASERGAGQVPGTAAGSCLGELLGSGKGSEDPAGAGRGAEGSGARVAEAKATAAEDEERAREGAGGRWGVAREKASRLRGREEAGSWEVKGTARQQLRPKERHREPKEGPGNTGKQLQWGGRDGKAANRLWCMKEGTAAEGQTGRGAGGESKGITKGKRTRTHPSGREKGLRHKDFRTFPF